MRVLTHKLRGWRVLSPKKWATVHWPGAGTGACPGGKTRPGRAVGNGRKAGRATDAAAGAGAASSLPGSDDLSSEPIRIAKIPAKSSPAAQQRQPAGGTRLIRRKVIRRGLVVVVVPGVGVRVGVVMAMPAHDPAYVVLFSGKASPGRAKQALLAVRPRTAHLVWGRPLKQYSASRTLMAQQQQRYKVLEKIASAAWPRCSAPKARVSRGSRRRSRSSGSCPTSPKRSSSSACSWTRPASAPSSRTRTACKSSTSAWATTPTSSSWSTSMAPT